ncbi:pyruvate decarboxylase [Aspergillus heteromorphus CBS 117.55]|uniref:Pyruvate decarboxylase n=1 Tax=Aspergillus heteromorphus CBS 117.55 TaxID=1448321 RepID=A0A317VHA5_9EURO|nr:pyruvate decarboxylase [Aspergillus heteromorphus CBS 117.55]PWY72282.1 pyruvate decarboxylase [Aspergillus heteromorphus CBS 117.55]
MPEIPSIEAMTNAVAGKGHMSRPAPTFAQSEYNVGKYLAYRLEEIGIKDYFVIPGDFNLLLLDQILKNDNLRLVGCCNELNAGYTADGYARSSPQRVAVVVVTFMVGGLSLINAIAGAYSDRVRVIVVCGAPPSDTFGQDSLIHHTTGLKDRDQALRMFEQVTAASVRLDRTANATAILDGALIECLDKSLPVYIEVPIDIPQMPCESPMPLIVRGPPIPSPNSVRHAFNVFGSHWRAAKRPVIIVGTLARHSLATDRLVSLVEKLGCPVFCQPDAKSVFPEPHPQFQGTFWGSASDEACLEKVMRADLWVEVGSRWFDYHMVKKPKPPQVAIQPDHLRAPDGGSINSITIEDVCDTIIHSDLNSHYTEPNVSTSDVKLIRDGEGVHKPINQPLTSARILEGIQSILKRGNTLIVEAGDSWFNGQKIKLPYGVDYQKQMMYGSIGWSLPAILGSQLARPDGRTILMIGDGSFQMTAQELSTMIRLKANPVIFIFNGLGYKIQVSRPVDTIEPSNHSDWSEYIP